MVPDSVNRSVPAPPVEITRLTKPAICSSADILIKRSEFNAGQYAPYAGDDVHLDIAIEAIAPQARADKRLLCAWLAPK